jgi:hypothetical protein
MAVSRRVARYAAVFQLPYDLTVLIFVWFSSDSSPAPVAQLRRAGAAVGQRRPAVFRDLTEQSQFSMELADRIQVADWVRKMGRISKIGRPGSGLQTARGIAIPILPKEDGSSR